ncbi:hypothetical protein H257_18502 [Aphanomyces astaci]|uniref:Uncharacterized protein n=1 Tax=Aphanomyces astaci TaxID=112090 RepID=W4FCV0_APHAT|nr:hypothetical protein H257_18502 [Aphanomyces astaci]ETV64646.1 hypothetical protein H257_18502 [Aphanomyces astaci]|eukprot:XP_009845879.1 hypothetical protein H257_18502 [Aphanomyces astaci]
MAAQQETLQNDRFSTFHDVVAQIQSEQPGVNIKCGTVVTKGHHPRNARYLSTNELEGRTSLTTLQTVAAIQAVDQAAGRGVYLIEPNEITSDDEDTQLTESESDPGSNELGGQITQSSQFTTEFHPL